jgi:hypothetical protein
MSALSEVSTQPPHAPFVLSPRRTMIKVDSEATNY